MISEGYFSFKGQKAVKIPGYGHSSIVRDKKKLCQIMYMKLAEEWIRENVHLHLIGHFANDRILKEILFHLGFGAILAERLRDLSPVEVRQSIEINRIENPVELLKIQIEHNAFIKPHLRGTGIGTALLNRAISLARKKGYDRMMVEHETANYFGGNFWSRYFDPYIYFSMRYIDNRI